MITEKHLHSAFDNLFRNVASEVKAKVDDLKRLSLESGKPIVYIAGKVTGLDADVVKAKFAKRKAELVAKGYIAINPCDFIDSSEDWFIAMAICLGLLPLAKYINLLHDWQDSKGANIEKELADNLGIQILTI